DVVVDSQAKGSLHAPTLKTEVQGTDVKVTGGCPDITLGHCSATLIVHVPAGTNVEVDAGSGDIVANDLNANATLRTGWGAVVVRGLGGTAVQLQSASGDVYASGIRAPVATAQTASGDVELSFAVEPQNGQAQTHSGDVRVLVPKGAASYNATANSDSG